MKRATSSINQFWQPESHSLRQAVARLFPRGPVAAFSRTMKNKTSLLLMLGLTITCLSGCSFGVPKTTVDITIGNTHFKGGFPKQLSATNLVAEVDTNGTARFMVGSIQSVNDAMVIDKAAAGDVARINALKDAAISLMEKGKQLTP